MKFCFLFVLLCHCFRLVLCIISTADRSRHPLESAFPAFLFVLLALLCCLLSSHLTYHLIYKGYKGKRWKGLSESRLNDDVTTLLFFRSANARLSRPWLFRLLGMVFASHFQICHFRLIHTLLSLSILQGSYYTYTYYCPSSLPTLLLPPPSYTPIRSCVLRRLALFCVAVLPFSTFHSLERADELLAGGVEDPTRGI